MFVFLIGEFPATDQVQQAGTSTSHAKSSSRRSQTSTSCWARLCCCKSSQSKGSASGVLLDDMDAGNNDYGTQGKTN